MTKTGKCLLVILLGSAPFAACERWVPESYVLRNDDVFYAAPVVWFSEELRDFLPKNLPEKARLNPKDGGEAETGLALKTALRQRKDSAGESQTLLVEYAEIRGVLDSMKKNRDGQALSDEDKIMLAELVIPPGLPDEFRLYLEGARAHYLSDTAAAHRYWEGLLALPEERRRHQSVVAAYMLARTTFGQKPDYERVRLLAQRGFDDPMGLAAASYGWEAQFELHFGSKIKAMEGYFKQWATGYLNAEQSLQIVARAVFREATEEEFQAVVALPATRAVLTAFVLTRRENPDTQQYRERLRKALVGMEGWTMQDAGRFALLDYQHNQLDSARAWLDRADSKDALALWVRGKLMLRDGKTEEGRIVIETLAKGLEQQGGQWRRLDTRRAWGEVGLLYLREARFVDAADAFDAAGSRVDFAYVVERLLPTDQALEWVTNRVRSQREFTINPREILARRLMRERRFEEAMTFFSQKNLTTARKMVEALTWGEDPTLEASLRARHLWTAARLMREEGMEIMGTELYPDFALFWGQYSLWNHVKERAETLEPGPARMNRATPKEIAQGLDSAVKPEKRFHYRYLAAELAERAAALLPEEDPDAARMYCIAGAWLKNRDPDAADRFYKLLVLRCPNTPEGKIARTKNWFPADLEGQVPEPFSP